MVSPLPAENPLLGIVFLVLDTGYVCATVVDMEVTDMTTITHGRIDETRATKRVEIAFHADFPAAPRAEGGKWAETSRVWFFDQRPDETTRALGKRVRTLVAQFDAAFVEE